MRFQYDSETDTNIKINDRYEFYDKINLDNYLHPDIVTNNKAENNTYLLHAVLVHSGDNNGGHYVVFINPKLNDDNNWFKFDDEIVSKCSKRDAINNNYGYTNSSNNTNQEANNDENEDTNELLLFKNNSLRQTTNAYMLVYIKESLKDDILLDVNDIPVKLKEKILEEKRLELQRKKERTEAPLYMNIKLIFDNDIKLNSINSTDLIKLNQQQQLLLLDNNNTSSNSNNNNIFKVKKTSTILEIKQLIANNLNIDNLNLFRLWPFKLRNTGTLRPTICLDSDEDNLNISVGVTDNFL